MKKKVFFTKLLSCILAASVTADFAASSLSASGTEFLNYDSSDIYGSELVSAAVPDDNNDAESTLLYEIEELRTENSKRFMYSDGTVKIVQYDIPIHYNNNGKWADIDNTLISETQTDSDGFDGYANKSNNFSVKFSNNTSSDKLLKYQKDNYKIFWSLDEKTNKGQHAELISSSDSDFSREPFALSDISSGVEYNNIIDSVDLHYYVVGDEIKENIVLNSKLDNYSFKFELKTNNIELVKQSDGSINALNEKNEIIFTIPAPFMYDSGYNYSDKVEYILEKENNGKYSFTISADKEWIESENINFPITIDPILKTSKSALSGTMAAQNSPAANFASNAVTMAGKHTSYGNTRAYYQFPLPELDKSDIVVDAEFTLYQSSSVPAGLSGKNVYAYKVTGAWSADTVTWNNQPAHSGRMIDYIPLDNNDSSYKVLNLTGMVREWYSNMSTNYGFVLIGSNEADTATEGCSIFANSSNVFANKYLPSFCVSYRNIKGIEDYWSYHTADAGNAGTAYINDFSGNLIFVNTDIAESGNRFPLTLSHVYNSFNADSQYRKPTPSAAVVYDKMNFGLGWQLSLEETIVAVFGKTDRYIYCDSDGTEHYMIKPDASSTVFLDEDGLGLTLAIDSARNYIITDNYGGRKVFNSAGYLTSCSDSNGNKLTLTYTDGRITSVTDGAGRKTALTYNDDNYLTKITGADGKAITYSYSNGYLVKVTYPDGTYASYGYDGGMLARTYDSNDAYKLYISYTGTAAKKVSAYEEKVQTASSVFESGQKVLISYSQNDLRTTYTAPGKDCVQGTSDDIKTVYVFDTYGRVVSSYSTDVSGKKILSANNSAYVSSTNTKQANRINTQISTGTINPNLLKSAQCESLSGWTLGSAAAENSTVSGGLDSSQKLLGSNSIKVVSASSVTNSIAGYKQKVSLTAQQYTLSGFIKTSAVSGTGACMTVLSPDGGVMTVSQCINGSTDSTINNGWQKISFTFTAPASADYTIIIGLKQAKGTAYFDCLQLEADGLRSNADLLENSAMESLSDWSYNSSLTLEAAGLTGKCLSLSGTPTAARYLYQNVAVNAPSTETFVLSGWGKASSVDIKGNRAFRLRAVLKYADGKSQTVYAPFSSPTTGWQFTSAVIVPKYDSEIVSITVNCDYHYNSGKAYFDNVCLIRDCVKSYTYDADGNVSSTVGLAKEKSSFTYSNNDLIKQINPSGYDYEYTYDAKHNLKTAVSERDVKYSYTYDSYGNPLTLTMSDTDGTMNIRSTAAYTSDGNYVKSVSDAIGHTVNYDYSTASGLLNKVTDPLQNVTLYKYDSSDRLTDVCYDANMNGAADSTDSVVSYAYSKGRLSSITHNGFKYNFTYDIFGKLLSTKAGTSTLITNTYGANNGLLTKSTYGNGAYTEYVYDSFGRVIQQKLDGASAYKWTYDGSGNLAVFTDSPNNAKYYYEYDITGRPVRSYQYNGSVKTLASETKYDDISRVSRQKYIFSDGTAKSYGYSYTKDNLITSVSLPESSGIYYSHDALNRLTQKVIAGANQKAVIDNYTYFSPGQYAATGLISKISYSDGGSLSYSYNANNCITSVTDAGGKKTTYKYDGLNQLVRENNPYTNKTYVYAYDKGGNITSVTEYAYTTASALGTAVKTTSYTYGDTNWKDKLTKYNGQTITYDAIGNPLTYRDGLKFTWKNGRELASMQNGTGTVNYTYNADGVRIGKSGSKSVSYVVAGTQILKETSGSNTTYYLYDEKGSPIGLTYKGTTYYYRKNLQGDIIAILDGTGAETVKYTYNAWGRVMSISGNMELGVNNPFRYRGYYYDTESNLYYLNSRYYDPATGRFINADGYVSTGQGIVGNNMFAYCGNNPVDRADNSGEFWDFICNAVDSICKTISNMIPAFAGCAGAAASDGPLPFGDIIGILGAGVLIGSAVIGGIYDAATRPTDIAIPDVDEKEKDRYLPIKPPKKQAYFTFDPYDFTPIGLVRNEYPGKANGRIIKWKDPVNQTVIFEWDEDFKFGSHYHAMMGEWNGDHCGIHYFPGAPVPEPWNSIYFGG